MIRNARAAHRVTRYHGRRTRTMHCCAGIVVGEYARVGRWRRLWWWRRRWWWWSGRRVGGGGQTVGHAVVAMGGGVVRRTYGVLAECGLRGENGGTAATSSGLAPRNGSNCFYFIIFIIS